MNTIRLSLIAEQQHSVIEEGEESAAERSGESDPLSPDFDPTQTRSPPVRYALDFPTLNFIDIPEENRWKLGKPRSTTFSAETGPRKKR